MSSVGEKFLIMVTCVSFLSREISRGRGLCGVVLWAGQEGIEVSCNWKQTLLGGHPYCAVGGF